MEVGTDLNGAVAGVVHLQGDGLAAFVEFDGAFAEDKAAYRRLLALLGFLRGILRGVRHGVLFAVLGVAGLLSRVLLIVLGVIFGHDGIPC